MSWFKRSDKKIVTPTKDKKETPDGLWYKTPKGDLIETKVLEENNFVTPDEGFHTRIGSKHILRLFLIKTSTKPLLLNFNQGIHFLLRILKSTKTELKLHRKRRV